MASIRRWKWPILAGLGLLLLGAAGFSSWKWQAQRQRREIPREWARLAPYPPSACNLRASTSGGPLTRAFHVSFSAPKAEIERWLQDSPGTREATVSTRSTGLRHFVIKPGGGAQHAEVNVDDGEGLVSIYVYWS